MIVQTNESLQPSPFPQNKEAKNKQTAPKNRRGKVSSSSHSYILVTFMLEPEEQKKLNFDIIISQRAGF